MSEPMITIKKSDGSFTKVPLSEFKKMQAGGQKPTEPASIPANTSAPASIPTAPARPASGSVAGRHPSGSAAPVSSADRQTSQQKPAHHAAPHHKPASHHTDSHHKPAHHAPAHTKHHTEHAKTAHPASHPTAPARPASGSVAGRHPSGSVAPAHSAGRHPAKHMARVDAGSPLEEKLKIKTSAPLFSPKREKQVEEVLAKLGFTVMPDILGRLKSLILAKLKDIKSEDETRELLVRSIKNGGLGLTEQQVEKVIKSCGEISAEGSEEAPVPVLKGKMDVSSTGDSFSAALHTLESELELPAPTSQRTPVILNTHGGINSVKNPLNSNREGSFVVTQDDSKKQEVVAKIVNSSMANEPVFKLDTRPAVKQSMQDVTASSMEMGPVEEIKSVTLMDFRRLSGNPEEAAKRLQQKMLNLQEESFVWYLDALAAYHNSPLYLEYIQAVCQSLAERKSLANVLTIKNGIKLNEVLALIEMERSL